MTRRRWRPGRRRVWLPGGLALLVLVGTLGAAVQSSAATAVVFKAVADSYVRSDQPTTNFGTSVALNSQASSSTTPAQTSYIQFVVSNLPAGTPASAQLKFYTYATSSTGLQIWSAANTWTETGLTYNNAPPLSSTMVGAIPSITSNTWVTLDVSSVVTGNGTYTFAITTTSTANKQQASRETTTPPQLSVQVGSSPASVGVSSGSGQSAATGTAFASPLAAVVSDSSGAGVPNASVTFSAPTSGASGTFADGTTSANVTTDSNGIATAPAFAANATAGTYAVTANVSGLSPASFSLTNTSGSGSTASPTASATSSASSSPTVSATSSASSSPTASATSSPSPSPTPPGGATTTSTFKLTSDAYVRSDYPDTNYGAKYNIAASSSPDIRSYVAVNVTGLSGPVVSATLQWTSYSSSAEGIDVYAAPGGWAESTVTYNNAPACGSLVAHGPNIVTNSVISVDASSAITGNGTYYFCVKSTRTSGTNNLGSRESSTPPSLKVLTSSGSSSTPSPSPTSSSSTTSSPSSTPSPSSSTPTGSATVSVNGGGVQSAMVGSAFAAPLSAKVTSASGTPVANAAVTFVAPATGASGAFPGGAATVTVNTDTTGVATSPQLTANGTSGSYAVTATVDGATQAASFSLTNTDPTIVAAGDIACTQGKTPTATSCQQVATSDLAISLHPDYVLPLGDDQYELGSLSDYQTMYDPSWGRLNSIAYPVPGNHEYGYIGTAIQPTGGAGYFTYFGDRSHPQQPGCTSNCISYYSYDIGSWHVIALDSQCAVIGGCNPGNPEYNWLLNDLNAHANAKCTLAYWHIPLYSSSQDHQPDMKSIYSLLYTKKADVVLTGHAHFYERFAPQDANGNLDTVNGIPQFIVGSGGRSFFSISQTPAANSQARIANTFGVLQMTLSNGGYSWKFAPTGSSTVNDSGSGTCH